MIKPLHPTSKKQAPQGANNRAPIHRRPLAQWIAAAFAMSAMHAHAGGPPLSQSWLASQRQSASGANAQGTPGSAGIPGLSPLTAAQAQQQQSVQQALQNLNSAAQAVATQISNQQAAQQAAQALAGSPVPDGIAAGGLQVAAGIAKNPALWQNANAPTQSVSGGQTDVEVKQTAQKAILTWDSFNVGRHTTLHFDQTGGTQTDGSNNWIVLNRINDTTGPSKIFGQIKAEGSVYLINRNGILFGAGSQVNTHSLLATSMNLFSSDVNASNAFFLQYGITQTQDPAKILDPSNVNVAFLSGGATQDGAGKVTLSGDITIEKGASIQTQAQGYTLIAAPHIVQAGSIVADGGTAILASSDTLQYVPSQQGDAGTFSVIKPASVGLGSIAGWDGSIENDGIIQVRRGAIDLYGTTLKQSGVLVASTSLSQAGQISLDGMYIPGGSLSSVELGIGSVTTVLPEKDGETTTSSSAADQAFQTSQVNISANGSITLDQNALIEAPSGNVSLNAVRASVAGATSTRIYLDQGAIIDVSGLADVELPMAALLVSIPRIGQNELADSPLLRNSFLYTQKNIVVDSSQSGVRADGLDWVGSPVLNAAGYVQNIPRSIDQLMLKGGTIGLAADEVITRTGSQLRADGGYLNYLPGWIQTPNLLGADGRIYNIASADPEMNYVGFAGQFNDTHSRWGVTDVYNNPLLGGMVRYDSGFIQGADAGSINIGGMVGTAPMLGIAVLDGDMSAHAYAGRNQVAQATAPMGGSLSISSGDPLNDPISSQAINYRLVDSAATIESSDPTFDAQTPLGDPDAPGKPQDSWYLLSTDLIDRAGFSKFKLAVGGDIEDDAHQLKVHPGGEIDLIGTGVEVASGSSIQASSGTINITTLGIGVGGGVQPASNGITIDSGATLDARGMWVNDSGMTEDNLVGKQYIDGGSINLTTLLGANENDISLAAGSVLDVSSGGYVQQNGLVAVDNDAPLGRGGDITLATHVATAIPAPPKDLSGGRIVMDGSLLGYGFAGGGSLNISASQIQIGGEQAASDPSSSLLYLPASFFSGQGFASYQLQAAGDAAIADNTTVVVKPANLLPNYAALAAAPTGSDVYAKGLTSIGYLDDYHRWLDSVGSGQSAGFSLQAGVSQTWFPNSITTYTQKGSLTVGNGATVQVDPGASVNLQAADRLDIFGSVIAHGGDIDLSSHTGAGINFVAPDRALWLGPDSLLDASGVSLINPIAPVAGDLAGGFIPRTGTVLDGGQVDLSADQFLLAQSGARIDVSGASDIYDLPTAQTLLGAPVPGVTPTQVWSDAGSIELTAAGDMLFDASLIAHPGAAQGRGGSLTIRALNSGLISGAQLAPPVAIVLQQSGDLLPDGYQPGDAVESGGNSGVLHFAVDRLKDSGITDLTIGPDIGDADSQSNYVAVPVIFAGDVSLNLARSVTIDTTALVAGAANAGLPPKGGSEITGAGTVSISAPYVYLANGNTTTTTPLAVGGDGSLNVQGEFIDIGGRVSLAGFAQAGFHSDGDLRFYLPAEDVFDPTSGAVQTGWLYSSGDMDFSATRIYPVSDYAFLLDAAPQQAGQTTTIHFENSGNSDSSTPLSAGGTLVVAASQIEQGGTIWVPSGNIVLGIDDAAAERTALGLPGSFALPQADSVQLQSGSTTSVSLNGAVLPFGSTVDGQEWRYDGATDLTGADLSAPPVKQISINGSQVSLQQGATVDVSGGGDLQAFEWIPGTGGSRDVLSQSQTSYATSTTGTQQPLYPDNRAVYAVIPGYSAPVGAHDFALEKGAGAGPAVGQAVYLSGVPGLPPGIYTLLPARYATFKGAYRVVQNTNSQDAVLGRNTTLPDGTQVVSGYFVDALTGAHDARTTTFDVQSSTVWQQYSQYTETDASQFFATQAEHAGVVAPPLPQDAGHLILDASRQLELGATLTASTGSGGRGAEVDIAGQSIQILGVGEQARDGYLTIDADGLSTLGASSLLIGGTRSASDEGDVLDIQAGSVVLSNDAAHPLSGPEIILATNGTGTGIEVDAGSVLRGEGDATGLNGTTLVIGQSAGSTPAVNGDGALLRVSSGPVGSIVRHDVTGIDGAAGTAKGDLTIADGATIEGGNALSIDATGNTQVGAGALLGASNIDVTANRIAFIGDAAPGNSSGNGFLIGDATLRQFDEADNITLRSRSTLDFLGDVDVTLDHNLELDASALTSDGGTVDIHTAKLVLTNDTGGATGFAAGTGQLSIQTGELDLGDGAWTLRGFGGATVAASQGIVAQGDGVFDFGQLDVNLQTPRTIAATGASTTVQTGGALSITALAGTPLDMQASGGILNLSGGSVLLDTDIEAPAGKLAVTATSGDIVVGGQADLNVGGVSRTFNDVQSYLPGGTLILGASGNVQVDSQATLDIAGDQGGGNSGQLNVTAGGQASLGGQLLGSAASGYLGGNLNLNTNGAVDLDTLADTLASSGMNGSLVIRSGAGDLDLSADHRLTAHDIILTADGDPASGGWIHIDGTLDASGTFGGPITLYGKSGVDVEGSLLTFATASGRQGGDIEIGTDGRANGSYNPTYGYEEVLPEDSGSIIIGSHALLKMGGDGGDGSLLLRAPLLTTGDVNVTVDSGAQLIDNQDVTLEAFATWSTDDHPGSNAQHFDGVVDPAGWYAVNPATGQAQLVAGHFVDASGNIPAAPDPTNAAQMADYLAKYMFVPDTANADHQSFYGYINGDSTQGAGTLMSFVQTAGINVGSRFDSIANFHIRPGIDLINPDTNINQGDISVLTNWNLGAGTQNADGSLNLVYRYGDQAPILDLRAERNLDIRASITDGFFQSSSFVSGAPAQERTFEEATAAWQLLVNEFEAAVFDTPDDIPGIIFAPVELTGSDAKAIGQYYGQYVAYADYMGAPNSDFFAAPPLLLPVAAVLGLGIPVAHDPAPQLPQTLNDYPGYMTSYEAYLKDAAIKAGFDPVGLAVPDDLQTMAPPPTTQDEIIPPPPPLDNSPSPLRTADNPMPLLSATLSGGNSSSYRLVAGANFGSADPLAVQAANLVQGAMAGQITLGGHTDYVDQSSTGSHVIYTPTLVRTGNGDIDMASSGDIVWLDDQAPAAIYTGGVPSGTPTKASVVLWQSPTGPEWVVNNPVNPIDAGDISLQAGGNIIGIQQVVDTDGSVTGTQGLSFAQYWWPWMQTSNTANSSSINFSAFDQGIMSVGGNVSIAAGGDIRQLAVSLPSTWTISNNSDGSRTVNTIGSGDLTVNAGGDILSGDYFVAHGTGNIHASGSIGADFSEVLNVSTAQIGVDTPVATLLALQDAQVTVTAGRSVDIGGVYDPSWLDMSSDQNVAKLNAALPAGHFDGQSYSVDSSLSILAAGGDLRFGSLPDSLRVLVPDSGSRAATTTANAGFVMPATMDLTAANGSLYLLSPGELYPSADGNLTLLAQDSIHFDNQQAGSLTSWGLIDAPASFLPSPLNTAPLQAGTSASTDAINGSVTGGYLYSPSGGNWLDVLAGLVHQQQPLHGDDSEPVRIYALDGDIVDGEGGALNPFYLVPNKPARIEAGRDVVDLLYIGQQTHASDISLISAGRDIYDTSLTPHAGQAGLLPSVILQGGPGTLQIEAGRDIGPLTNEAEVIQTKVNIGTGALVVDGHIQTGIDSVGNAFNPYLPSEGASVQLLYGVAPGIDQAAFIAQYVDPSAGVAGIPSLTPDLVSFMDDYVAGLAVDTGLVKDKLSVNLTSQQAWDQFQQLSSNVQLIFVQKALFKILAEVGSDYNNASSPFQGQYARGYAALSTLFPASSGYTDNGAGAGGINGAQKTVDTGDLDIRNTTIQTQQGGDIDILAPGGQALLGSTASPPVIIDPRLGTVAAGPNDLGLLTLRQGDINIFTDRSVLLAQSRVFTEQGGSIVAWSSNGDINAGKGVKTTSEIPPLTFLCDIDAFCKIAPLGEVSGAGIATLQTVAGAPVGDAFLMAPRGTVDAGDAGIRVSGNLVVAAAQVANADNIQVQGEKIGVPIAQSVNVGALSAASAAAGAVSHVAEDMANKQRDDARNQQPSVISVHVLGAGGDASGSLQGSGSADGYDQGSPVQVLGAGRLTSAKRKVLTTEEQTHLSE